MSFIFPFVPLRSCRAVELRCQVLTQQPLKQGGSTLEVFLRPLLLEQSLVGTFENRLRCATSCVALIGLPRFEISRIYLFLLSQSLGFPYDW